MLNIPYPNEHAARVADPDSFDPKSMRSKDIGDGVRIIIGKKPGSASMVTQAYRFDKDKFTPAQARAWLKDHDVEFMTFEPTEPAKESIFDSSAVHFRLLEASKTGLLIDVHIISPGWGSSGYYSEKVLRKACESGVYPAGMHMHIDHPTRQAEKDQPARTIKGESPLAAVLTEAGHYDPKGWDGPGVYSKARVMPQFEEDIRAMDGHIGISHYVSGKAEAGEAEGKKGPIITELIADPLNTVDFVTVPGAGGHYRTLGEALADHRMREASSVPDNPSGYKIGRDAANCNVTKRDFPDSMPFSEIRKRFAFDGNMTAGSTGGDEANFTLLKLPHHDPVSGDLRPNCVRGALQAIGGARTGTPMNLGTKTEAVKAHLQAHLDEINAQKAESKRKTMGDNQESLTLTEIRTNHPEVVAELKEQLTKELKAEAMSAEQKQKLEEAAKRAGDLEKENKALKAEKAQAKAREYVVEEVTKAKLPEASGKILTEALIKQVVLTEDGAVDAEKFAPIVAAEIKNKQDEIAAITKEAGIKGNGGGAPPSGDDGHKALVESYEAVFLSQGKTAEQAKQMAEIAAGGR